jgi:hypothetical protein
MLVDALIDFVNNYVIFYWSEKSADITLPGNISINLYLCMYAGMQC